MSRQNKEISQMLEKELRANPGAATADLQEKASKIKKSVVQMSLRSFHGTHVGAVKRRISGKKGGRTKGKRKKSLPRGRPTTRAAADLRTSINSLIEREIQTAHQSFNGALERALRKAKKIEDFEKVHEVLLQAKRMF
jgi:hypothetical protein